MFPSLEKAFMFLQAFCAKHGLGSKFFVVFTSLFLFYNKKGQPLKGRPFKA